MPSHAFKKIYVRATRMQDLPFIRAGIFWSEGRITEVLYVPYDGKSEAWWHEDEWMAMMQWIADTVKSDAWSLAEHLASFEKVSAVLKERVDQLTNGVVAASSSELSRRYRAYLSAWGAYIPFIWTPWAITYVLDEWFAKALKETYPDGVRMYEALAVSTKPIQMQECIETLLSWKITNGSDDELEALRLRYGHLGGYSVNDVYWTKTELLDQIKDFANPEKDLACMQSEREEAGKRVAEVFATLSDNPLLLKIAMVIHEYIYLRTERIDRYKWYLMNAAPFYRELERRFELGSGWAANFSEQEIFHAFEDGILPGIADLKHRAAHGCVSFIKPKETVVISDPDEQRRAIASAISGYYDEKVKKEVKGRVAYKGNVEGIARVIIHIKDIPSMQDGEILIANMTHPDYMPAIYKAKGIVTDEGGIVCHAAIISRELKIPCVIGTGEATKIFKTGDMVEVDAMKGIVRKTMKKQWQKLLSREGVDLTSVSEMIVVYSTLMKQYGKGNDELIFTHFENTHFTHYVCLDPLDVGAYVYRKHLATIADVIRWYRRGTRILLHAKSQSKKWEKRLAAPGNKKDVLSAYREFRKEFEEISPFYSLGCWFGIEAWQKEFEEKLDAMIRRNHAESDRTTITRSVYQPWKKTSVHTIQKKLSQGDTPEELAERYQFLRSWAAIWYRPITAEWIRSVGGAHGASEAVYPSRTIERVLRPTPEEKHWLAMAPYMVFFKDWRDELRREHVYQWTFLFERIALEFGIPYHDVGYYTLDEIERALKTEKRDATVVERRKKFPSVLIMKRGKAVVFDGGVPEKYQRILDDIAATKEQTVQGLIAQKGVVQGRVIVLKTSADIARVQSGDILVANTTHPNYLPAMKKAAAFVTNEGGMISHAAIVARELGRPCIVGTKNATDVLKEGDVVEVDAERGIVRKIS
ncbi:MAG: PEP-utilizing enzyme [Patescibacteria group bacterium]